MSVTLESRVREDITQCVGGTPLVRLNRIADVELNVCVVKNDFFGGGINIAGLLTAQDIMA